VSLLRAAADLALRTRWRRRAAGSCAIPVLTATAPIAEPMDLATSVSMPAVSLAVSFTFLLTVFAVIAILLGISLDFRAATKNLALRKSLIDCPVVAGALVQCRRRIGGSPAEAYRVNH
jgi:hypothetical protein